MLNKNLPPALIEQLSRERSKRFYAETKLLPEADSNTVSSATDDHSDLAAASREPNILEDNEDSFPLKRKGRRSASPSADDRAMKVVRRMLSGKQVCGIQGRILEDAGIESGSAQSQIKKILLREELIFVHVLQSGKGRVVVWEPTDKAFTKLGIEKPKYHSKGGRGLLHQFCVGHVKRSLKGTGYEATVEYMLANGKAVDVVGTKPGKVIFVEVGLSDATLEIINIEKDMAGGMSPNLILMVVKDTSMKETLEKLIAATDGISVYSERVKVDYVGKFLTGQEVEF